MEREHVADRTISWSRLYAHRRAVAKRFGKIFDLPLVKRLDILLNQQLVEGPQQPRVLEVGAADRALAARLKRVRPELEYRSLDIDPQGDHDYRSWEEVREPADLIVAFEVVEHIPTPELAGWLTDIAGALAPGGAVILSTPNTFYPPAYLRDITHQTPLCYDELGGMLEAAGLQVTQLVRIYNDPLHRKLLRRWCFGWLFRMIGIDFARQIAVVAVKPQPAQRLAAA